MEPRRPDSAIQSVPFPGLRAFETEILIMHCVARHHTAQEIGWFPRKVSAAYHGHPCVVHFPDLTPRGFLKSRRDTHYQTVAVSSVVATWSCGPFTVWRPIAPRYVHRWFSAAASWQVCPPHRLTSARLDIPTFARGGAAVRRKGNHGTIAP